MVSSAASWGGRWGGDWEKVSPRSFPAWVRRTLSSVLRLIYR